jgi:hypothetical protein
MTVQTFFGIAAGVFEFAACGIYIWSILKKKTKPDRVTWWVLALVSGMITASYYASGARETIWLPAAYTLCFLIVSVLSLKYGDGPLSLTLLDRISLAGAILSAGAWALLGSTASLFMNMATELIGLVPTINKAYRRPWTESRASWLLATFASLLNVFAIREWTFVIAAYPLYVFVTNAIISYFIVRKKVS